MLTPDAISQEDKPTGACIHPYANIYVYFTVRFVSVMTLMLFLFY